MNRSRVVASLLLIGVGSFWLAQTAQAQCRGGGSSARGSAGGSVAGASVGGTLLTSPGSWAYDQMAGQALQRQFAMQQQQQALAEQARRAESLAKRQYYAAQRREQKAKSAVSPGLLASSNRSMSLEFSPSNR